MELISRITLRRHEMGDAGERAGNHAHAKVLAIFRVLGQSPERARKMLIAEMVKAAGPVIVLGMSSPKLSQAQKEICLTAMEQGIRLSTSVVFCGADPAQIFGRQGGDGRALQWYPSIPVFVASYEVDGGRQAAHGLR